MTRAHHETSPRGAGGKGFAIGCDTFILVDVADDLRLLSHLKIVSEEQRDTAGLAWEFFSEFSLRIVPREPGRGLANRMK